MGKENFFNIANMKQGIMRKLGEGIATRIFVGENVMISVARIEPDTTGTVHSHPEEQWGFCFRGSGIRTQDGVETAVNVGDFWRTPGGVEHSFQAGPEGAVVYDVFAPPRQDYTKPGAGFGG